MLYFSLVVSALLLLFVNGIARVSRSPSPRIVGVCAIFVFGPILLTLVLPPVFLQSLLTIGTLLVWRRTTRRPPVFLGLSCGATLLAYGLAGISVVNHERLYARLRDRYPYESMEARLPAPQERGWERRPVKVALAPSTTESLARLEEKLTGRWYYRTYQLKQLHEQSVQLFINSPGFGIARMMNPSEQSLALRSEPVPLQPGSRLSEFWSPGEPNPLTAEVLPPLDRILQESILEFVNAGGFGFFKDRRHVSGFDAHRFGRVPGPENEWSVQTLELVSLLLHDEPEVYVSTHLPRMDRLHGVPTRPLDRFEKFGLTALNQGETIFASRTSEGMRMLGAVRSAKQCVSCHGGERGDLLGAFSYSLRSDMPHEPGRGRRASPAAGGPPGAVASESHREVVRQN